MVMQNKTVTIHQAALSTLANAQVVINQAEANANKRRSEASTVVQSLGQMRVDALTLKTTSQGQKTLATDLKVRIEIIFTLVQKCLEQLN